MVKIFTPNLLRRLICPPLTRFCFYRSLSYSEREAAESDKVLAWLECADVVWAMQAGEPGGRSVQSHRDWETSTDTCLEACGSSGGSSTRI